jgi:hypothetical protein
MVSPWQLLGQDVFSQTSSQRILKSIMDLESQIYERDIWLTDLEPRTVIISSPGNEQIDVVFIDFAHSLFNRRRDDPLALQLDYFLGEYVSPILRWKQSRGAVESFAEWVDWDGDAWLKVEFAHTVASIKPGMEEAWCDLY